MPSLMEVRSKVRLEEDRTFVMSTSRTPAVDIAALNVTIFGNESNNTSGSESKNNGKQTPICDYYKKLWHTREQ